MCSLIMEVDINEFTARAYQIDLYEIATKQNSIIYLPTGAGKTFIAVMLIKELSADIRRPYSEGGKHTVFVANTIPLVLQQCEYISRLTGLSCAMINSNTGVDFWNDAIWMEQLEKHQVLILTPQVLVDGINGSYLLLNKINLIIFDECHRGVNEHPMRQIMKLFEYLPKEQQPRILGLSATLLNANTKCDNIEKVIQNLEVTFQAKIITVMSRVEIEDYCASPREVVIKYNEYIIPNLGRDIIRTIDEINEMLKHIILKSDLNSTESSKELQPRSKIKKLICMLQDIQEHFMLTGLYGVSKSLLLHLIQLECMKKYSNDVETMYVLEYLISEFTKFRKLLEDEMEESTEVNKIYNYTCDRVQKLFAVLKDFNNNKETSSKFCCLIFVQRRFTVKVLYHILKNQSVCNEEFKFLRPEFAVGFSSTAFEYSRESLCLSKWNKEALHRFRNGLSNCMIATDCIDEGIDIPKCTLVIRFNLPMDIRSYIQSKGRARYSSSQYILLIPRNDTDYLQRYKNFKLTELYLQKLLLGKSMNRIEPTENEIKKELYVHNIKPYIVIDENKVKYTLTEHSAISIVNKYCASLYQCKFVQLTPIWKLHTIPSNVLGKSLYQISLKLPTISPLKTEIFGDSMRSISIAKRSVAMKTCIELHKIGELSDRFVPNTMDSAISNTDDLFPNWIDENKSESALIGTYKKKRLHKLNFPTALYGAYPLPDKQIYLHIFHAVPTYSAPHDDNRHLVFYNLLSNNASFGILSTKQMPKIPSFPIFMDVGELHVTVNVNYAKIFLTKEQIKYIKVFHHLLFSQVVPVIKSFMVFDNYNYDNCFLIVPVNENWEINWDILKEYQCIERIPPPVPFHLENSDYELALVIPNYRGSPNVYIVTQVCEDLTPSSSFPTDNFFSYAHYYKQKHGLVINDLKQPMLEVKTVSRKINCIKPRSMQSELKRRNRAEVLKDLKEHLVPELCTKIKFPALYWLKTTMLPSILHRVSQFLIAEDLRLLIAVESGLGFELSDSKWLPLKITDEETEESFESLIEVSTDENIENLQPEPVLNGPEIDVLNTEAYPWTEDQEPPNMDRNIEEVQMIQIEHYCQFMSIPINETAVGVSINKKSTFINNAVSSTSVPCLKMLSLKDSCNGPSPVQIMYALTTKLGHDVFNLERLETLGDSYLKFITTVFLYDNFPHYNEGRLTTLKGKMIGNRNLYYCGNNKHIPGSMKVDDFIPFSNFIAPAYTTFRPFQELLLAAEVSPNVLYEIQIPEEEQCSGCISEATKSVMQAKVLDWETAKSQTGIEHYLGVQTVSDKTVADCVEALIGVYLTSMGIKGAATLLKWFKMLPKEVNIDTLLFDNSTNVICEENVNYFMPWASDIETKIGYKFQNRAFLLQAFTHPSYTPNNITECYQRLEFLGDAILDFLITCYIYENCGNLNPGLLTDLRSALVNNITFACLAVRYGLHTALLAYAPHLNDSIHRFVRFQEERNHAVNDELLWILLEEDECNMAEYVDVPKVLGDLYESTIGAIYLDCGKSLTKVWELIYSFMHKEINEFSTNIPKQPIRVLYEIQGAQPQFLKSTVVENGSTVMVPLKVIINGKVKLFHGFGTNKKQAKCAAAKQALKSLLHKT
ncbi:endoribonuclease Dcr-2 isoform X3 [Ptiloglossa arizonensis]|uniref:endoribonuclease Dcr-2 isoform X3 n=1 Tax=Ptiloglossa arizonensis TaxID=3350558 RepID=UPI003FA14AD4